MSDTAQQAWKRWWDQEGSGMRPLSTEDTEQFAERITEIAWSNGAYARADEIERLRAELSKKVEELAAAWMVKDVLLAELAKVRQQRDESRRDACAFEAINRWNEAHPKGIMSPCAVERISREVAVERGWDCFAQQEGGGA